MNAGGTAENNLIPKLALLAALQQFSSTPVLHEEPLAPCFSSGLGPRASPEALALAHPRASHPVPHLKRSGSGQSHHAMAHRSGRLRATSKMALSSIQGLAFLWWEGRGGENERRGIRQVRSPTHIGSSREPSHPFSTRLNEPMS